MLETSRRRKFPCIGFGFRLQLKIPMERGRTDQRPLAIVSLKQV